MGDHPIEGLMSAAMENIQEMVEVNTIVGDAVETKDGTVIIPISKVNFGFGAGGAEYAVPKKKKKDKKGSSQAGFGGGSGAGVMLNPMAFLVVDENQVRLLPVSGNAVLDQLLNVAPQVIDQLKGGNKKNKEQQEDKKKEKEAKTKAEERANIKL
ncbi:sporulation protein YtfJ [Halobacteroides halobius DSM 5150]|uniref:Sporulation protein YtfJ n=1 Tax=Halobacteroides halobius (strain ATCC 35273 / DSM 5150 / MD-1) TaxID=748449 RepID=L0K8A1_HALHC|nr:GerW family sporulation protein [Halobacteroides halobius]AGB40589.1 sporulation protein YtfJ [Halobacteroides halobius DSM 5150]